MLISKETSSSLSIRLENVTFGSLSFLNGISIVMYFDVFFFILVDTVACHWSGSPCSGGASGKPLI